MESSLNRFKEKFIEEASSLLDRLEKDLLELENRPADQELIESAFRAMHTIKGASSMFGFDFICEFTHHMESMYQLIRDNKLQFNHDVSELTFQSIDHIRKLIVDEHFVDANNKNQHNQLIYHISKMLETDSKTTSSNESVYAPVKLDTYCTWHILLRTTEAIFFRGINLMGIFSDLSLLGEYEISRVDSLSTEDTDTWSIFLHSNASVEAIKDVFLFIEDDCTIVNLSAQNVIQNKAIVTEENNDIDHDISILDYIADKGKAKYVEQPATKSIQPEINNTQAKQANRISVDSSKLDQLMFLVSELITVNSQLNIASRDVHFNTIRTYLEKVDTLSKQFRNNALEIRLVPLGDTVLRFQRLIRDLSKQLGKKVNFITYGTNTELDKNTIDQLTEPLMHIIRNCIDHGIETPEVRFEKGKSEQGAITLTAFNSGNNVFITIADDGCGIDNEKVRQKAIEKALISHNDKPTKKELYDFIFMPGFSTAQSLTEVSGRGVGMDVVKRRINDLRGEVFVESEPGKGTTFTLKLQQSMSIIDSLLFSVGDNYFTVPISEIEICLQLENSEIIRQQHTATIPFNNQLIPFVDLRKLFVIQGSYRESLKSIIIRNNDKEIALLCDRIIGEHQAVLKPMGKSLQNQKYITAASQMGDGQMAFMIDTNSLYNLATV